MDIEDIGPEAHPETDQFRVEMGPAKEQLDFEQEVEDGWAIFVPAGTATPRRRAGPTRCASSPRGPGCVS